MVNTRLEPVKTVGDLPGFRPFQSSSVEIRRSELQDSLRRHSRTKPVGLRVFNDAQPACRESISRSCSAASSTTVRQRFAAQPNLDEQHDIIAKMSTNITGDAAIAVFRRLLRPVRTRIE